MKVWSSVIQTEGRKHVPRQEEAHDIPGSSLRLGNRRQERTVRNMRDLVSHFK